MSARSSRGIRVLIADDHPLMREGMAGLVDSCRDMRLVGQVDNGAEAVATCLAARPDVTLMDVSMPGLDGIEATLAIRRVWSAARIMVVTSVPGYVRARRALKAGAAGFLPKSTLAADLAQAIRDVHAGRRAIPPDVAYDIATHADDDELSFREIDVLRLVAEGNRNKLVGVNLGITEDTVKAHVRNIMRKLGAYDRTHAVTLAFRRGIIDPHA